MGALQQVLSAIAASEPPGYDVIPLIGDSNLYFGATLDAGIDVGHARMYAYAPQGVDANTIALAQDPFQHDEYSVSSDPDGKIGFAGQWGRDYLALNPTRRVLFVPYGRGGSGGYTGWTPPSGALLTAAATLTNDAIAAAIADQADSLQKAVLLQIGTNDLNNASPPNDFRKHLYALIDYWRANTTGGASLPVVIGGLPHDVYATDPGGVGGAWYVGTAGADYRQILSSIASKFAYSGYADSESPSNLGATSFHFTAAEQRSMAARYETARLAAEANSNPALAWDTNDKGSNMVVATGAYTNSDVTSGATAAWNSIRATRGRNSGKYYFELEVAGAGGNRLIGLSNAGHFTSTYLAGPSDTNSSASYGGGQPNGAVGWTLDWSNTAAGWSNGDVVMIAVDFSAGKAWVGRNGTWGNSGDPAAGTGSWISGIPAGQTIWPTVSMYANESGAMKLRRLAQLTHTIPTGFLSWG